MSTEKLIQRQHILTVTLNPSLDRTVSIPDFKTGKSFLLSSEAFSAGGKGLNVARALSSLRIPTLSTGFLGGHNGQQIQRLLKAEGLKADFVFIDKETRSNLTVIDRDNCRTRVMEFGPSVSPAEVRNFQIKFSRLVKKSDVVIFSGRNANQVNDQIYAKLIREAHVNECLTVLDAHGDAFAKALKSKPFMIKPNLSEAEEFLGAPLKSLSEIKEAVYKFHAYDIPYVIISLGERGAVGSKRGDVYFASAPKVKAINDVGCGDAMVASLVHSYAIHLPFPDALRLAVATSTASTMNPIPGKINQKSVDALKSKVSVRSV